MWWAWIGPPCEKLWPVEFLESFRCSFSSLSIYYSPESEPRVKSYDHLNFSRASVVQFWASRYIMGIDHTFETKVMAVRIWPEHPWSISRVSIYSAPESDRRVKCYDHLNFSRASVVQFRASLYVMRLNRTSELKFMSISVSWELPLFKWS